MVAALQLMMFSVPDHGTMETYMMQGTELNPQFSTMLFNHTETMKNDGNPDLVDPGLYYPAATSYGYYCTGIESPGEWDDHRVFSLDGTDIQYTGAESEILPYLYYTPSYGYGESPYNPYNPCIPGALIGLDGTYVGTQPYYTVPPYSASSPSYYPAAQNRADFLGSSSMEALMDAVPSAVNKGMSVGGKHKLSSASVPFPQNSSKPASNQIQLISRVSEGSRVTSGASKRPIGHKSTASGSLAHGTPPVMPQGANGSFSRVTENISHGKVLSQHNPLKISVPMGGHFSDFASSTNGRAAMDGSLPKYYYRRPFTDGNGSAELLGEQNRGPRTSRSRNQFVLKAYTTRAGVVNSQGNIVISADEYNKDGFSVDYGLAKFFVIKSYSEDDVHKSIKYNVWSSTPNGNKKLNSAYEDAQRIAAENQGSCPIFLYFSVNASGQFCGVAEMVGSVDFLKDMDFWQQDKWSGSFPVKWHIIKDVPNANFRHIILENNEHKPVTNSRDTQEIMYRPGMEMLKIFRSYIPKTSLLDDFMYYEQRQRIMHDERSRLLLKINALPFKPSGKVDSVVDMMPVKEKEGGGNMINNSGKMTETATKHVHLKDDGDGPMTTVSKDNGREENDGDGVSTLKMATLTINSEEKTERRTPPPSSVMVSTEPVGTVTVGSLPVKVNGFHKASNLLTVGTITLDPRAMQPKKMGFTSKEKPSK
ncbi:YT521-B-like domain [Dionaea muscipula]